MSTRIDQEVARLDVDGDLDHAACAALLEAARGLGPRATPRSVLDLSAVARVDSVGIAAICEAYRVAAARGVALRLAGANAEVRRLLDVFRVPQALAAGAAAVFDPLAEERASVLEAIGGRAIAAARDVAGLLCLAAETVYWTIAAPIRGELPRVAPVVRHVARFGVDAVPIVSLIGCLMGVALAINASYQLAPLGAIIYVANLVGVATARELGPLITAIVVCGRSGAEIAAEIGTMVVSEEVDALRTIGLNPVRQLVVPKVLALAVALPLLTAVADVLGVFGGYLVGVGFFGISGDVYLDRTLAAVKNADFLSGLAKSLVFAVIIALVGCHRGFHVGKGAEGVGRATTSAVVTSIFLVIVADTVLSTAFYWAKRAL